MVHKAESLTITDVDLRFLHAVHRYRYITAAQLNYLLYPNNHDENRYVQRRLKRLVDAEYLERKEERLASIADVFTLGWRGRRHLRHEGYSVSTYHRPSEATEAVRNSLFRQHTLAVVDVLVAAERLSREVPEIELSRLLLEQELRRMRLRAELPPPQERAVTVVPDAFFELSVSGTPQSFLLELDRGSERPAVWRNKVAALAAWATSPRRDELVREYLTFMVVAPTASRRDHLRVWTAQELEARGQEACAELYVFTDTNPATVAPQTFFLEKQWYQLTSTVPDSLLDRPESQS